MILAVASASYSSLSIGPIAPTVAQCPKAPAGYMTLCPVGSNSSFETYVSYGGAYNPTGW